MAGVAGEWLCTNRFCLPLWPNVAGLLRVLFIRLSRPEGKWFSCERWVRYRMKGCASLAARPLQPVAESACDRIRRLPGQQGRLETARRFSLHGLNRVVGWLEEGRPLALNWIFLPRDNKKLRGLPYWGGMYPALAPGEGQAENLIVFPPALRIPGGNRTYNARLAATVATFGVHTLYSHIHAENHRARRWIESAGWHAYGSIFRMRIVPGWEFHLYLHEARVAPPIAAESPTKVAGYTDLPT